LVAPEKFCIIFKTKKSKIWRKLLELWSVTHIQTHRQSDMGFFSAYAIISFGLRARNNLHYLFLQTCLNWKKFFWLKTKGFFLSLFFIFFLFLCFAAVWHSLQMASMGVLFSLHLLFRLVLSCFVSLTIGLDLNGLYWLGTPGRHKVFAFWSDNLGFRFFEFGRGYFLFAVYLLGRIPARVEMLP
jgi:hypothetical protein